MSPAPEMLLDCFNHCKCAIFDREERFDAEGLSRAMQKDRLIYSPNLSPIYFRSAIVNGDLAVGVIQIALGVRTRE